MREPAADFEVKDLKYLMIYSFLIHHYNICDALITGCDETNVQFVPTIKRARVPIGQRKVRIIGIGKEKPQITATFCMNALGYLIYMVQLIYMVIQCITNQ